MSELWTMKVAWSIAAAFFQRYVRDRILGKRAMRRSGATPRQARRRSAFSAG
jgi:hypothetical protein